MEEKINEIRNRFFEKMNKIDKLLAKQKGMNIQIIYIKNERILI